MCIDVTADEHPYNYCYIIFSEAIASVHDRTTSNAARALMTMPTMATATLSARHFPSQAACAALVWDTLVLDTYCSCTNNTIAVLFPRAAGE